MKRRKSTTTTIFSRVSENKSNIKIGDITCHNIRNFIGAVGINTSVHSNVEGGAKEIIRITYGENRLGHISGGAGMFNTRFCRNYFNCINVKIIFILIER